MKMNENGTVAALANGIHADDWDLIPEGELGSTRELPLSVMPDFVPYGAWCKCNKCGLVHRSTYAFDCYGEMGELLTCERCKQDGEVIR